MRTSDFEAHFGVEEPKHPVQKCVLRQHDEWVLGMHGAWLNAPTQDWQGDSATALVHDTLSDPSKFDLADGPLQGLCFNVQTNELLLHGDFVRQHPVFYHATAEFIAFAPSLTDLIQIMQSNAKPVLPNQAGAASLLAFGAVLGDATLVSGVRKLMPGHSLHWQPGKVKTWQRTSWSDVPKDLHTKREAKDLLSAAISKSIQEMVELNRASGCGQTHLLSGGLDSRLVMLGARQHESELNALCFSRQGALDHAISRQIAEDAGVSYRFHDLRRGQYMMNTQTVLAYDGDVNFLASAHHHEALDESNLLRGGLLAAGHGAAYILKQPPRWSQDREEVLRRLSMQTDFRKWAREVEERAWALSPQAQVFQLMNHAFLYGNGSAFSTREWGVMWGPFASRDVILTILRMSQSLLQTPVIFLEILAQHGPLATKYIWERYRVRPVHGAKLRLARWLMLIRAKVMSAFSIADTQTMSPIQFWYDNSTEIQNFYQTTFDRHREVLLHFPDLKDKIEEEYPSMNVMNKASVLTLLLASNAYFARET